MIFIEIERQLNLYRMCVVMCRSVLIDVLRLLLVVCVCARVCAVCGGQRDPAISVAAMQSES